jgi:hypothetical protein
MKQLPEAEVGLKKTPPTVTTDDANALATVSESENETEIEIKTGVNTLSPIDATTNAEPKPVDKSTETVTNTNTTHTDTFTVMDTASHPSTTGTTTILSTISPPTKTAAQRVAARRMIKNKHAIKIKSSRRASYQLFNTVNNLAKASGVDHLIGIVNDDGGGKKRGMREQIIELKDEIERKGMHCTLML